MFEWCVFPAVLAECELFPVANIAGNSNHCALVRLTARMLSFAHDKENQVGHGQRIGAGGVKHRKTLGHTGIYLISVMSYLLLALACVCARVNTPKCSE